MNINNVSSFSLDIKDRVLQSFKNHNFDSTQYFLLKETFLDYQNKADSNFFSSTLFIFYFFIKSFNKKFDEKSQLLACFGTLYIISANLFDDIQDDDLKGKVYDNVGLPIVINTAITLLFLSLEFLTKAIDLEEDQNKKSLYLKIFSDASVLAVKGQHKDLMGAKCFSTSKSVLEMQIEKSSSISMIAMCAGVFSDCNNQSIDKIKLIAEKMTLIFQIVDDIRDIYGKKTSPDLLTNKVTYPISCFLEIAESKDISKFENLKNNLPNSISDIRSLLYISGAIKKSCEMIEDSRQTIYKTLHYLGINDPIVKPLLFLIDSFSSSVYNIPILPEDLYFVEKKGEWNNYLNNLLDLFFDNMKNYNPPPKIKITSWHLPHWMYEPKRNIILYPDLDGLPEEILPIHSHIFENNDLNFVKKVLFEEAPFTISHEIFHYWRKYFSLLTNDYWYEEYVANSLSTSYIKKFLPDIYVKTKLLLDSLIIYKEKYYDSEMELLINNISDPKYQVSYNPNYKLDPNKMFIVHIFMMKKIYEQDISLENNMKKFF